MPWLDVCVRPKPRRPHFPGFAPVGDARRFRQVSLDMVGQTRSERCRCKPDASPRRVLAGEVAASLGIVLVA